MAANGDKAPASTNGRQDAGQAVQLDARLLFVAQVMIGHTVTAQVIARAAPDGELHPPACARAIESEPEQAIAPPPTPPCRRRHRRPGLAWSTRACSTP
jgi:hypothetical protein